MSLPNDAERDRSLAKACWVVAVLCYVMLVYEVGICSYSVGRCYLEAGSDCRIVLR